MKIITLVENSCGNENCIAEHGLSIYIETEKHKLLLDTGQTDAIVKNAEVLGIDPSAVDTVILSHGHYDHSGGILPFSKLNRTAQIIMQFSTCRMSGLLKVMFSLMMSCFFSAVSQAGGAIRRETKSCPA